MCTSTKAGNAGSVHAISVSDGKLCPLSDTAITYTIYFELGFKLTKLCEVRLVSITRKVASLFAL